jgi:hypothetical protein
MLRWQRCAKPFHSLSMAGSQWWIGYHVWSFGISLFSNHTTCLLPVFFGPSFRTAVFFPKRIGLLADASLKILVYVRHCFLQAVSRQAVEGTSFCC